MDYKAELRNLKVTKDYFIGIDSDGCVFDTMEIKQKECFCPNFIKHFGLQAASKFAREVWQFVNLYSKTRGCNRFLAVQTAIALINDWDVFAARGLDKKELPELDAWIDIETKLGNPALEIKVAETNNPELKMLLNWSLEVNERIQDMVYGISPFPKVRESLQYAEDKADMIVVSQTPFEALNREWKENSLDSFVEYIAGQEAGTKTEHLQYAATDKYDPKKILMIGDAPGDLKAAEKNNVLFYPIIPGKEEFSWEKFNNEALKKFFADEYAGSYQKSLLGDFEKALPKTPPWK
ncbi:MAG: HAD hydrolase-like protein [Verrucomicrobiota bacterium]|nr:HAD hydrolase-like protein [Verrucomicrobiota bacterium]